MPIMTSRRSKKPGDSKGSSDGAAVTPEVALNYALRFVDPKLRLAAEAFGKRTHRSLNNAINALLEDALRAHGLWPPPETGKAS